MTTIYWLLFSSDISVITLPDKTLPNDMELFKIYMPKYIRICFSRHLH